MKTAFREKYCGPESLTTREILTPTPSDNEVLVRVRATTVNRTDCAVLSGKPFIMRFFVGLMKPKSPIPGTDFAGVVEATGRKVTRYRRGDRVFGFNDLGLRSQAEYLTIAEESDTAIIPAGIDFDQAAASLEAAHYAFNFITKVKLAPGLTVLVNGASGGIGSAVVQFLKHFGLEITAVCNTKNVELVKSLGATRVIDYMKEDFTRIEDKFDFVFDAVGKSTFRKCRPLMKDDGVYVSSELGPKLQNPFLALVTPLLGGRKVIFPVPMDIKRSIAFVSKLLVSKEFKPVIDRTYPLERISEAYVYVAAGEKTGNVVIKM